MSGEKVAIIIAGGSGMGAASARRLAEDGYCVGILSSSDKGENLGRELGGFWRDGIEPVTRRFGKNIRSNP